MSLENDEENIINPLENWVKLVSQEGHEFIVSRDCVQSSGTIRAMLNSGTHWAEQANQPLPTIQFETITTAVMEKIIQYWYYKQRYDGTDSSQPIPKFDIDMNSVVKVLLAANFLDT